ncbi:hypothetical protein BOTNAR_0149g00210 [Botryotinia narcissicola]|uniref:Uncharacterized protein n=1 Tax=Botryotinia narcissicola TaxID=278944 RepID=A0A4Z1IFU3_9HELO|nr:hypothetical protein BOTNAR_0149g00210 [Botryotinia narcissicola]
MSAQSEHNSQVNEAAQENGFYEEFDADFDKAYEEFEAADPAPAPAPTLASEQEAAAVVVLAPEPQVENSQVNEDAEDDGFDAEFYKDFEKNFAEDQRIAAPAPAPVAPVVCVFPVVPTPLQQPNAYLATNIGIRPKFTIAERQARARDREQAREQAARQERERRVAAYRASGTSKEQAICLD